MKTRYIILCAVMMGFVINSKAHAQGVPAAKPRTENEKQHLSFFARTFSGGESKRMESNGVSKLTARSVSQKALASDKPVETGAPMKMVAPKMPPMQEEKRN